MAQRTFAPDLIKAALCVSVGETVKTGKRGGRKEGRWGREGREGGKEDERKE